MATVSFRVPDDLKRKLEAHDEVNWSAVLRARLEEEFAELESRNPVHAVATSERLGAAIDAESVADRESAEVIREWRDARYGPDR